MCEWLLQTKVMCGAENASLLFGVDEAWKEEAQTIDNINLVNLTEL